MSFLTYLLVRPFVFVLFAIISSPIPLALVWLANFIEEHDALRPFKFLVAIPFLFWLFAVGWMVHQTTHRMILEYKSFFTATKESLSYARLCLSFLPVVGHWFEPKETDEDEKQKDTYGDQLRRIVSILQRSGFAPSVRGDSAARFVYAEHSGRAVELSHDGVGFFVELFEQPAETSVRDHQQETIEHATKQAVDWLSRSAAS